jgi:hypothetical protein
MTSLRRFLTFSALMALSGFSVANAQPVTAGDYKMAVGNSAPCTITLSADGAASAGACATAPNVGHWQQRGSTLQLNKGNGEIFALLKVKGDAYAGTTFPSNDGLVKTLTLTPTAQTAALTH